MAQTNAATGLTVQQWDSKAYSEALNANIFKPFLGTNTNALIQVNETLTKKKGDKFTFALRNKLINSATRGSATLEGNEEDLVTRSFIVQVDQFRNAVLVPVLEEQKSAIPLRDEARDALIDWKMELDRDKYIEALGSINGVEFSAATETQRDVWLTDNADRTLFGDALSNTVAGDMSLSLANIDNTNDKLTSGGLSLMKRLAKTASPRIGPIKPRQGAATSDMFVLFVNSLQLRDLTTETAFQNANRDARKRGKQNPIFLGADYIFDNIVIYEVEDIPTITGEGAGGIDVAGCYLCGRQALAQAVAKRWSTVDEEFDYKDKQGVAVRTIYEIKKMLFGSGAGDTDDLKDHGVFTGYFASVADS